MGGEAWRRERTCLFLSVHQRVTAEAVLDRGLLCSDFPDRDMSEFGGRGTQGGNEKRTTTRA